MHGPDLDRPGGGELDGGDDGTGSTTRPASRVCGTGAAGRVDDVVSKAVVCGFEPENLVTGLAAATDDSIKSRLIR